MSAILTSERQELSSMPSARNRDTGRHLAVLCPKELLGSTQHVHHALLPQALLAFLLILSCVSYHSGHSSGDVSCKCWYFPQICLLNFYLTYFLCI